MHFNKLNEKNALVNYPIFWKYIIFCKSSLLFLTFRSRIGFWMFTSNLTAAVEKICFFEPGLYSSGQFFDNCVKQVFCFFYYLLMFLCILCSLSLDTHYTLVLQVTSWLSNFYRELQRDTNKGKWKSVRHRPVLLTSLGTTEEMARWMSKKAISWA